MTHNTRQTIVEQANSNLLSKRAAAPGRRSCEFSITACSTHPAEASALSQCARERARSRSRRRARVLFPGSRGDTAQWRKNQTPSFPLASGVPPLRRRPCDSARARKNSIAASGILCICDVLLGDFAFQRVHSGSRISRKNFMDGRKDYFSFSCHL